MVKKLSLFVVSLIVFGGLFIGCGDKSSPTGPSNSQAAVGTWVDSDGFEYVFNSNGSVTGSVVDALNAIYILAGESAAKWTYNATTIFIDGEEAETYTINGNTMTKKNSYGEEELLTKK